MLKSQRIALLPVASYDLDSELEILDAHEAGDNYGPFNFGSWSTLVLANNSGIESDNDFRPYCGQLTLTGLGRRLPVIMSLVARHFQKEKLQWVRIFRLSDGLIAPHVDFLEFSEAGTRLQVPLRTSPESLNSENDLVYHLRRGEVWKIHTTDPHSAQSISAAPARLFLCLDFAGTDQSIKIRNDIPITQDIQIVSLPPLAKSELEDLLASSSSMTPATMRTEFRRFASVHFRRHADATAAFDWFTMAAERTGDEAVIRRAMAFRTYCIEKRGYREEFDW